MLSAHYAEKVDQPACLIQQQTIWSVSGALAIRLKTMRVGKLSLPHSLWRTVHRLLVPNVEKRRASTYLCIIFLNQTWLLNIDIDAIVNCLTSIILESSNHSHLSWHKNAQTRGLNAMYYDGKSTKMKIRDLQHYNVLSRSFESPSCHSSRDE